LLACDIMRRWRAWRLHRLAFIRWPETGFLHWRRSASSRRGAGSWRLSCRSWADRSATEL